MISRKYTVLFIAISSFVFYMLNVFVTTPFSWILLFIPAVCVMCLRPKWSSAIVTAIVVLVVIFGTEIMLGDSLAEHGMILLQSYMIGLLLYVAFTFMYMKQQEMVERYKALAYTDPLTNIYNRRFFNRFLETDERDVEVPLACVMIDIDHFKKVNDTYGHVVGDQVLNHVVQIVQEMIHEADHFIRIGGEEFLIILANHLEREATDFADEIRRKVEATPFYDRERFIPITISLGVTSIHKQSNCFVKRVGAALLEAKRNGRNQVINY